MMHIWCNCGPGGTMREVPAVRDTHRFKAYIFGDRAHVVKVNRCKACGHKWPAVKSTRRKRGRL